MLGIPAVHLPQIGKDGTLRYNAATPFGYVPFVPAAGDMIV